MTWRRYVLDGFMTHVVPSELEVPLVAELTARGAKLMPTGSENPANITEWCLDTGGPAHLNRPYETFTWCGLSVSVPSEQVAAIFRHVIALEPRSFTCGTPYHKLKLWMHATVMSPEQSWDLLAVLTPLVPRADDRAREFSAACRRTVLS